MILSADSIDDQLLTILREAKINKLYIDPSKISDKDGFEIIYESPDADYVIYDDLEQIRGNNAGFKIKIESKDDEDIIVEASDRGAKFVIIETVDWKIIPLENIIARLNKKDTKIYAKADNVEEVRTMFNVLQLGVDGVILNTNDPSVIRSVLSYLDSIKMNLEPVEVIEAKEAGNGERVCVDTTSILKYGEGMLVGNRSNFLFLVHNESIGSSFTSPRPFRVNAGAVHCYTLMANGKTKYLSELESGDEVLVIDKDGNTRRVIVGRAKIETRPMILIKAKHNSEMGSIIVQNAETIRFMKDNNEIISVTEIKKGDKILAYVKESKGRHFGMEVDEYILEK